MKYGYFALLVIVLGGNYPMIADTISFVGDLRTNATVTYCGQGCTLDPSDPVTYPDWEWAQFAAVVESFNVPTASPMTAVTFSYGGGVNGAGTTILQGGFEPYLSLFDSTGNFLGSTYSGTTCPPGANTNSISGYCYDVGLDGGVLTAGDYQIAITAYANMSYAENLGPPYLLSDGFTGLGNLSEGEDLHFAFDVNLAPNETGAVPEPGTFGLFCGALGLLCLARKAR